MESFPLWNPYDPMSMDALRARLREIVGDDRATDAVMVEFHRVSHVSPPGVSQFEQAAFT